MKTNFPELTRENIAEDGIDRYIEAVCEHLKFSKTVAWKWMNETHSMGIAHLLTCRISLNLKILTHHNWLQELKDTIVHEICHLVANERYGDKKHGSAWKVLMISCDIMPNVCFNLSEQDKGVWESGHHRRFLYECPKCLRVFVLSATLHNRIIGGQRRISRCCHKAIRFKSNRET